MKSPPLALRPIQLEHHALAREAEIRAIKFVGSFRRLIDRPSFLRKDIPKVFGCC